jgi:hypothetical protein
MGALLVLGKGGSCPPIGPPKIRDVEKFTNNAAGKLKGGAFSLL